MERHGRVMGTGSRVPKALASVERCHKRVRIDFGGRSSQDASGVSGVSGLTSTHQKEKADVNECIGQSNDSNEGHACANAVERVLAI